MEPGIAPHQTPTHISVARLAQFRRQQVRDLAWACFGPPLVHTAQLEDGQHLADCQPQLTARRDDWLQQLDRQPDKLLAHLQPEPRRLGLYFEQLWHFFLNEDPDTQLIAHNVAVRGEGRTLGEFDCLYYCQQRQRPVHLELAIKFYLYAPGYGPEIWLGPNSRDCLERKLAHLLHKQTRLAEHSAAATSLAELGITNPIREVALRGYLFCTEGEQPPAPPGLDNTISFGPWLRAAQLRRNSPIEPQRCIRLPRLRWLCPAHAEPGDTLLSGADLAATVTERFHEDEHPVLFAALGEDGLEQYRFFVVPDHWPGDSGRDQDRLG